jgi:hypothetical protein
MFSVHGVWYDPLSALPLFVLGMVCLVSCGQRCWGGGALCGMCGCYGGIFGPLLG